MSQWFLTDPLDNSTWTFPINPNKMTSPFVQHNTTFYPASYIDGKSRAWRTPQKPYDWQFAGDIRTKDHYDTLTTWFNKERRLHVTDHFGRTWDIQIVNVEMTPGRSSRTVPWRYSYVVKALMYGRLADVFIGAPVVAALSGYNPPPPVIAGTTDSGTATEAGAITTLGHFGSDAGAAAEALGTMSAAITAGDAATASNTTKAGPNATDSGTVSNTTTLTTTVSASDSGTASASGTVV